MNATGMRQQRLRLYAPTDRGSDGYVRPAYVFLVERWGSLNELKTATSLMQERLQTRLDAVCELADEVQIPINGIVIDATDPTDSRAWWIRGANTLQRLRRTTVALERITDEQFRDFDVYDSPSSLDGVHLINPTRGSAVLTGETLRLQ